MQKRGSQSVEQQEARDVRQRDVKDTHTGRDEEPEDPDDEIGRDVVAPLMAEHRDPIRRREQQTADGEVRRVPEVTAPVLQDVLR